MAQTLHNRQNLINKNATRFYAGLLALLMWGYIFSSDTVFIYILVCDFLIRIYMSPQMSPLFVISTALVRTLGFEEKFENEDAKEFASHVGLTLLFAALGAELLNETTIAYLLVGFLGIWKIAEAAKDFCFACRFYELLKSRNIELESL